MTELNSPVGVFDFTIPPELIRESCLSGKVYVQLEIGAFNQSTDSKPMSGEQDDAWKIDRLLLTFKGQRTPDDLLHSSPDTPVIILVISLQSLESRYGKSRTCGRDP